MKCPRCGLSNTLDGRCACGYSLETQPVEILEPERFSMFGTTFRGAEVIRSPASNNAKRHLIRSWVTISVVTILVLIWLLWSKAPAARLVIMLGASAYGAFASYWGVVGFTGELMDRGKNRGVGFALSFSSHHFGLLGVVGIPLILGILYGVCGGGVYEFLQNRKLINNPGLSPK